MKNVIHSIIFNSCLVFQFTLNKFWKQKTRRMYPYTSFAFTFTSVFVHFLCLMKPYGGSLWLPNADHCLYNVMNRITTGACLKLIFSGLNHRYFHSWKWFWFYSVDFGVWFWSFKSAWNHFVSVFTPHHMQHCSRGTTLRGTSLSLHPIALCPKPCSPCSAWIAPSHLSGLVLNSPTPEGFSWADQAVTTSLLCVFLIPIHTSVFVPALSLTRLWASWGSQPCLSWVCAQVGLHSICTAVPGLVVAWKEERKEERKEGLMEEGRKKGRRMILWWGIRKSFL